MSRPKSMTRSLIIWLTAATVIFWIVAVAVSSVIIREEFDEVFDSALQETNQRLMPLLVEDFFKRKASDPPRRIGRTSTSLKRSVLSTSTSGGSRTASSSPPPACRPASTEASTSPLVSSVRTSPASSSSASSTTPSLRSARSIGTPPRSRRSGRSGGRRCPRFLRHTHTLLARSESFI